MEKLEGGDSVWLHGCYMKCIPLRIKSEGKLERQKTKKTDLMQEKERNRKEIKNKDSKTVLEIHPSLYH